MIWDLLQLGEVGLTWHEHIRTTRKRDGKGDKKVPGNFPTNQSGVRCGQTRDPDSDKVKAEDLHVCTVAQVQLHLHVYTWVRVQRLRHVPVPGDRQFPA